MSMSLPYSDENIGLFDEDRKIRVSGKILNELPEKLLKNDKFILAFVNKYYDGVEEVIGTNKNGIIDHINTFIEHDINFKSLYENNLDKFNLFLQKYKAPQSIDEFFSCINLDERSEEIKPGNWIYSKNVFCDYDNVKLDYINSDDINDDKDFNGVSNTNADMGVLNTLCCPEE